MNNYRTWVIKAEDGSYHAFYFLTARKAFAHLLWLINIAEVDISKFGIEQYRNGDWRPWRDEEGRDARAIMAEIIPD